MVMHRSLGRCEVGVVINCDTSHVEWHHRQRRGRQDHRPSNGLAACRPCHAWIHAHPQEAVAKGWIVLAVGDTGVPPQEVAAWVRARGESQPEWYTLTTGGTYT